MVGKNARKGISPLIAIVILIAITLAIGVFMAIWLQQVARTQTEAALIAGAPECRFVFLTSENEQWENVSNVGTLTFDVINSGSANVSIEDVRIIYTNGTSVLANRTTSGLPADMYAGDRIPIKVNETATGADVGLGISYVRILTTCSNANFEIAGNEITIS